jgi:hypothetical protein
MTIITMKVVPDKKARMHSEFDPGPFQLVAISAADLEPPQTR